VPFDFGSDEVNFDDTVSAICTITKGDPQGLKIYWMFQGADELYSVNLTTNDGIVITRNSPKLSVLNIDAVKARHRGNYSCIAQNRAGIAHHSTFLHVNGSKLKNDQFYFSLTNLVFRILQFFQNIFPS
jgi:Immunoglobulin domain